MLSTASAVPLVSFSEATRQVIASLTPGALESGGCEVIFFEASPLGLVLDSVQCLSQTDERCTLAFQAEQFYGLESRGTA